MSAKQRNSMPFTSPETVISHTDDPELRAIPLHRSLKYPLSTISWCTTTKPQATLPHAPTTAAHTGPPRPARGKQKQKTTALSAHGTLDDDNGRSRSGRKISNRMFAHVVERSSAFMVVRIRINRNAAAWMRQLGLESEPDLDSERPHGVSVCAPWEKGEVGQRK